MKITTADLAFSWCVRERSNWTCERCGTQYMPPTKALQCSHYFSRDNKSVRVYPDNAFANCNGCHSHLGSNPHYFKEFVLGILGEERYDRLVTVSNQSATYGKLWKHEQKEIARHYRAEYERMKIAREGGFIGRLEFTAYKAECIAKGNILSNVQKNTEKKWKTGL